MTLSSQDELRLNVILQTLNGCNNPLDVLCKLLKEFVSTNPNSLPSIISYSGALASVAIKTKDRLINSGANSIQSLLSVKSSNMNMKRTHVSSGAVVMLLLGAIVTLFPNGDKENHSATECKFFDNYLNDLKDWYEEDKSSVEQWMLCRCEYPEYIKKLIKHIGLINESTDTNGITR